MQKKPRVAAIARISAIAVLVYVAYLAVTSAPLGWSRVATGPFSVALPPGWRYERASGIDSFVGDFVGDGIRLQFDYGQYGGMPSYDAATHDLQDARIDFRPARILRSREPQGIVAVDIAYTDAFKRFATGRSHLSIAGSAPSADQDRIETIFRSVRFRSNRLWRLISGGER